MNATRPDAGDPIFWRCSCGELNCDWRGYTSRPICGGCTFDYSWAQVQGMAEVADGEKGHPLDRGMDNVGAVVVGGAGSGAGE